VPLLERDGCLRGLDSALADALRGQGRVALVTGEAGIGKTTLIERFVRKRAPGLRMLWGTCDAHFTPRPLGPLHDMATQLHGPVPRLLAAGGDRSAVFAAVLTELSARPTIGVFEDVHWADEATLDLLGFLGRRIVRTSTLLVLTYRDDELSPRHPLRIVLGELAASTTTSRVVLSPLSEDAVRTLVGDRGLDPIALHRRTAGNPFFVTEVLAAGRQVGMPPTIRDVVLARAARLSAGGQNVLEAAAVLGPRAEAWLLAAVSTADPSAIDECLTLGMLVAQAENVAFRHDLVRQAVLDTISPPRRILLHRKALGELEALPPAARRRAVGRLAHHAEGAGDRRAILEFAPPAARQAVTATAHREAARLYALALSCADELAPAEQAALLEAYSWESNVIDERSAAIAARRQAIAVWHASGDRLKEGENLARLVPMLIGVGQNAEAEHCSSEAVALLEALPPGAALALAYRTEALVYLARRNPGEAIAWGQRAIDLADRCGDDDVSAMTHIAVGAAWLHVDYARGCRYLEERLAIALASGREVHVANAFAHLGGGSAELHHFPQAEQYLADGIGYTDGRDLDTFTLIMLACRALTLVYLGRWSDAATVGQRVLLRTGMSAANRIPGLIALGRLSARGYLPDADAALDEALQLAESVGTAETLGMVRAARAERAWLAGDPVTTLDEACAAYDLAVHAQNTWVAGELAFWRWRAGQPVALPSWLAPPFAHHLAGDWRAAAAAWNALSCPYEEARALADGDNAARLAALATFQRLGARQAARRLGRELRAVGIASVPRGPYAATRTNPFGLTARQIDILGLLADGLSNPAIAAQLSIAPKTVDHHVAAILAKLDVHSRRDAASVARQHRLVQEK
jgi:DNA-binding CsgD family transcriptional regulator